MNAKDVSLDEQIACVSRELGKRHGVYKAMVAKGKMKQERADTEIAGMTAVLATLKGLRANQHPAKTKADYDAKQPTENHNGMPF